MKKLIVLLAAIVFTIPLLSLDRDHFIALNKKTRELAQQQDWKGMRETLIEIGKEVSGSIPPRYLLRMASVETRLGHIEEALRWMQTYADTGLTYDVSTDDDLRPLLQAPGFSKIADEMKARAKPIENTEMVCKLPLADLMPEDLTFEKYTGTFIVSSIQRHTLYRVTLPKSGQNECALKELPLDAANKRWPTLAVSFDPMRKALWMTSSAMPDFTGIPPGDSGKAALLAIDPSSGHVLHRFDLESSGPAVLGDMSVAADGTVYVSDSIGGGIYRVRGDLNTAKLEKIAGGFFSPQTPVLARDGKRLFVADYPLGIGIVDLSQAATSLSYLPHADSVATTGLDGLYLSGDSLIGVQNGTNPQRIVRFQLDPTQTRIISSEVIEQSERMGSPTHAIGVNGWTYVMANVGWDKVDDHGVLKPGTQFTAPVLLRRRNR